MVINVFQILSITALLLSLGGNLLVNYKKRIGFIVWIASNIFWIIVNLISVQINWSQIIMFFAYIGLNLHGFVSWQKLKTKGE